MAIAQRLRAPCGYWRFLFACARNAVCEQRSLVAEGGHLRRLCARREAAEQSWQAWDAPLPGDAAYESGVAKVTVTVGSVEESEEWLGDFTPPPPEASPLPPSFRSVGASPRLCGDMFATGAKCNT